MSLSTDNVKTGGSTPKLLQPGNIMCKINSIELEAFKFKPGGYHIILNLEGPDLGKDFEGFFLDKSNEALGRHKGQVGKVKATYWAFADESTKTKVPVVRDEEMLKFIKNLCASLGIEGRTGETIEDLITKFNMEKPFTDKYMKYCICGKEYIGKGNYTNYELFLPKYSREGAPFGKGKVVDFDPEKHIIKAKVTTVQEFGGDSSSELSSDAKSDFTIS